MATLASKLPYTHPFAGGYPYRGSQRLPSDPDAIDYLNRVKAADGGAGVETAVAMAVDDFFRGMKADGTFSALKAACLLCGARTLAGALVPLVGTAPTNVADGFVSGDYTRGGATPGLQGDGTSYLDSGRAGNADPLNDFHLSVYVSTATTANAYCGAESGSSPGATHIGYSGGGDLFARNRSSTADTVTGAGSQVGTIGISRQSSSEYDYLFGALSDTFSRTSQAASTLNHFIFRRNGDLSSTDARIAFYSIGEALDLEALDDRVSALVAAIGAAV